MDDLLLAADSGGSKTLWRILNAEGKTVGRLRTEGMGAAPGTLRVDQTVRTAFRAFGGAAFSGIFLSLGGPNTAEVESVLRAAWPDAAVTVSREASGETILRAAAFLGCSSAVLCGTGSTAAGLKNGRMCYSGGWGPLYGDGGSGGGLCRDALCRYLRSLDGSGFQSDLTPVFGFLAAGLDLSVFSQRMEAKKRVGGLSRRELAALLPGLYALCRQGAASAVRLFDEAAEEVCRMAADVTDDRPEAGVLLCGGFFRGKPELVSLCRERFAACSSARMVYESRFDPIVGACVAVLETAGLTVTPALFERILNEGGQDK